MSSTAIEEQLRRVIRLHQEANDELERRLAASGNELAGEWGARVREALASLERLGLLLAKVYASPVEDARAREDFVRHALQEFGPSWYKSLHALYDLVWARYPEAPDPEAPHDEGVPR